MFEESGYCLSRLVSGSFVDAVEAPRVALANEGFGVLTEIDVKATLAKKLDVTTRPFLILGACNPTLAQRALELDLAIGGLLPCNVVVAEDERGSVSVAAIDQRAMFAAVNNPDLTPVVDEVRARFNASSPRSHDVPPSMTFCS